MNMTGAAFYPNQARDQIFVDRKLCKLTPPLTRGVTLQTIRQPDSLQMSHGLDSLLDAG